MLYLLYGPDRFSAQEELKAIRARLDTDGNLVHNTLRLDGPAVTVGELQTACQSATFFAENRLVIVDGLLGRLAPPRGPSRASGGTSGRGRRGRGRGRPGDQASEADRCFEILTSLPETTTVVLLEEGVSKEALAALAPAATARSFPVLRRQELRQWAVKRAREQGATFSPPALERLTQLVDGSNLALLAQEIDKLATYAAGRTIEGEDIEALVSSAIDYRFYNLTDAVIAGAADQALRVLQAMDKRQNPPQFLLSILTRTYRQLILVQALLREGLGAAEIGKQLGIGQPFPLSKVMEQATRYPAARLEAAYRRILEADVALKTGALDPDTCLDLLIAELARMVSAGAAAGRR